MKWRIVPDTATEEMLQAGATQMADIVGDPYAHDHWRHFSNEALRIYKPMLAATPVPTDADIDELCRAMWPKKWQWLPGQDERANTGQFTKEYLEAVRDDDRKVMRAFLTAIGAHHG